VAGDEMITSPDQHKPTIKRRTALVGAFATVVLLVLMAMFGNHEGRVEEIWLFGIAGLIVLYVIIDAVLRRNGLRE
jgi:hypothetical protein